MGSPRRSVPDRIVGSSSCHVPEPFHQSTTLVTLVVLDRIFFVGTRRMRVFGVVCRALTLPISSSMPVLLPCTVDRTRSLCLHLPVYYYALACKPLSILRMAALRACQDLSHLAGVPVNTRSNVEAYRRGSTDGARDLTMLVLRLLILLKLHSTGEGCLNGIMYFMGVLGV